MIHSYTSLSMFDKCPQQYYQVRVLKAYPYVQTPEAAFGDHVHKVLEVAGKAATGTPPQRVPLPPDMVGLQWIVDDLLPSLPGTKLFEFEFNFAQNWRTCDARDWNNKYWTGKGDVVAISDDRRYGVYVDWKTGKDTRPDADQLELMAVFMRKAFPTLEGVRAGLLFTQTGKPVTRDYTVHQIPALQSKWEARALEVELAKKSNTWPTKPSALCPWCPHKTCPDRREKR